jgi:hypothetical protein
MHTIALATLAVITLFYTSATASQRCVKDNAGIEWCQFQVRSPSFEQHNRMCAALLDGRQQEHDIMTAWWYNKPATAESRCLVQYYEVREIQAISTREFIERVLTRNGIHIPTWEHPNNQQRCWGSANVDFIVDWPRLADKVGHYQVYVTHDRERHYTLVLDETGRIVGNWVRDTLLGRPPEQVLGPDRHNVARWMHCRTGYPGELYLHKLVQTEED